VDNKQRRFIKSSATASVKKLIDEAYLALTGNRPDRAARYVKMAWELIKKNRVRLPKDYRNSFCRKCLTIWVPEKTAVVYFDQKNNCLRIKCKKCGFSKRI